MKELEYLNIIKNTLSKTSYIGDDCAFLPDIGIAITQDSLVEDVHFCLDTTTPYLLGYKAVAINLSDLAAAAVEPKYLTISLALSKQADRQFAEEFYKGVNDICEKYNVEVIGGDITSSGKIFMSITAIGKSITQYKSSRKNAKLGDLILTTGVHGSSACGLFLLQNEELGIRNEELIVKNNSSFLIPHSSFINAHLKPEPDVKAGINLAQAVNADFPAMDTSDGLGDALYKMAVDSDVTFDVDFAKVPFDEDIKKIAQKYDCNYINWILWGGEDYKLVVCVPQETYEKLNHDEFIIIGKVIERRDNTPVILANCNSCEYIDEFVFTNNSYNHFA